MEYREPFGWRLRRLLAFLGRSQMDLANGLGKNRQEAGRLSNIIAPPSAKTLEDIGAALHVEPGRLLIESPAWVGYRTVGTAEMTSDVTGADDDSVPPTIFEDPSMPDKVAAFRALLALVPLASREEVFREVVTLLSHRQQGRSPRDLAEGD